MSLKTRELISGAPDVRSFGATASESVRALFVKEKLWRRLESWLLKDLMGIGEENGKGFDDEWILNT